MRIVLCAINAKYIHSNLGVYSLYTYAMQHPADEDTGSGASKAENIRLGNGQVKSNIDIHIREYTINNEKEKILNSLYMENADVVAFSCYIWNIDVVLSIARELKKVQPNVQIWLGGPEVSYDAERVLENNAFVQLVMRGEGEKTFVELVKLLENGRLTERDWAAGNGKRVSGDNELTAADSLPEGITMKIGGRIVATPDRPPMEMDELPFVYGNLTGFENRIVYYESARGCPFRCSYCLSSIDKGLRLRSLDKVKGELQFFLDNKVKQVKFIDRTFNANKEHSRAIWSYITEHDNGVTNFHFEVSADLLEETDFAIIGKMRTGLIQLEIGMQTTNAVTISEIRRTMNLDRLTAAMDRLVSIGTAHVHLDLIAGLPFEDINSFRKSFDDAWNMKPDNLQLGFLKVLKGSSMEEKRDVYGLIYSSSPPYEIMANRWMSYADIIRLKHIEQVLEVYGNSRQYVFSLRYLMSFMSSAFDFFDMLGEYFFCQGYSDISLKRVDRYNVLLAFGRDELKLDEKSLKILSQLLVVDLYHRENMKSRPEFAADSSVYNKAVTGFFINQGNKEYKIEAEHYDSKVYARKMHIEPVSVDIYNISRDMKELPETIYLLFDYDDRNPIDYNCRIVVLNSL